MICELHTVIQYSDVNVPLISEHSSNYREIDPRYGTLEDWDNLLRGVHDRGMKLM